VIALAAACSQTEASRAGLPPASPAEVEGARVITNGREAEVVSLFSEPAPALYPQMIVARAAPEGRLASPATVTLPYSVQLLDAWAIDETQLGVFARQPDGTWFWSPASIDPEAKTATFETLELGTWVVGPSWVMKPWQQRAIIGAAPAPYGRNVLVIHGWNGEPWERCQLELMQALSQGYDNVAAVAYPSGLDIRDNAAWLRGEIEQRWGETSFDVVAFSEGGLLARAAIEPRSWNGNRTIAAKIGRLVTIATPHLGVASGAAVSVLGDVAAEQMQAGSEFLRELNGGVMVSVPYEVIAGDLGNGSDGVVPVESALGRGVLTPSEATVLELAHSPSASRARGMPCDKAVYEAIAD
jgi:hypothetical protein